MQGAMGCRPDTLWESAALVTQVHKTVQEPSPEPEWHSKESCKLIASVINQNDFVHHSKSDRYYWQQSLMRSA